MSNMRELHALLISMMPVEAVIEILEEKLTDYKANPSEENSGVLQMALISLAMKLREGDDDEESSPDSENKQSTE